MIELNETKLRDLLISRFTVLFDNPRELKLFRNFLFCQMKIKNKFFKNINYDKILFNLEEKFLFTMYFIYDSMLNDQNLFSNMIDFDNAINEKINSKSEESPRGEYISNLKYSKIKNFKPNLMEIFLFIYNNSTIFNELDQFEKFIDEKNLKEYIKFKGEKFDIREFILLYKDTIMVVLSNNSYSDKEHLFKLFDLFFSNIFEKIDTSKHLFFEVYEFNEILLDLFIELIDYKEFRLYLDNIGFKKSNLLSFNSKLKFNPVFKNIDFTNSIIKNKVHHLFDKLLNYYENEIFEQNEEYYLHLGILLFYPVFELFDFDDLDDYEVFNTLKLKNLHNQPTQNYLNLLILNYQYYKTGLINKNNFELTIDVKMILHNLIPKLKVGENYVIENSNYFKINLILLYYNLIEKHPIQEFLIAELNNKNLLNMVNYGNDLRNYTKKIKDNKLIYDLLNSIYKKSFDPIIFKLKPEKHEDVSSYDLFLYDKYAEHFEKKGSIFKLMFDNLERIPILKEITKNYKK